MIFTCCEVADPFHLWDAFAFESFELREDFRVWHADVVAEQLALQHLQECLARSGKTTADYGLPLPRAFDAGAHRTRELRAERNYDSRREEREAASHGGFDARLSQAIPRVSRIGACVRQPRTCYLLRGWPRWLRQILPFLRLSCIMFEDVVRLPRRALGRHFSSGRAYVPTHVLPSRRRCLGKMYRGRLQRPRAEGRC